MNSTSLWTSLLGTLAENFYPPFYFALAVGLPSVLLYGVEVFVLVKYWRKDFNFTFYTICTVRAIISIFGYIGSYLNARLPKIGIRQLIGFYDALPNFGLNLIYFFHFYPFHLENIATAFLLLNRLTAIAFPYSYERYWHKFIPLIVLLIILLPLGFTWHIFTLDIFIRFQQDNENITFTLDYRDKANKPINATLGAYSAVIFMCVTLALNVACLIAYRLTKSQEYMTEDSGIESRLTFYALLTFLGQLLMAIYYVLIDQAVQMSLKGYDLPFLAIYNQYPWINDVGTVIAPAWIFLWACTPLRQRIRQLMPRMCKSNTVHPGITL